MSSRHTTGGLSLPQARIVNLPGRGEAFVRIGPHRAGAPTALLLHGWMGTADLTWYGLYGPLSERYNVVALDHRGHGRGLRSIENFTLEAAADDTAAVLDELGIAQVIAVGYSMGGSIALQLARRNPALVDGLVLCATALEWRARWYDRLVWRLIPVLSSALRLGADERVATRIIVDMAEGDEIVARWQDHLLGEAKRLNRGDAIAAGRALARFDARPFASSLGVPAAVVATRRDRMVQPRRQLDLAVALGAFRFDLEADHDVFLRQPDLWSETVAHAIDSVAARLPARVL